MIKITQEEAIHIAKTELGFEEPTPGRVWRVRRLDRQSEAYYLVQLGDPNAAIAVATIDINTGCIGESASLPGVGPHLVVDARLAIELAAGGQASQIETVWMPCRASKSPLYPLWEVKTPSGIKYVDQKRRVLDKLEPAKLGG